MKTENVGRPVRAAIYCRTSSDDSTDPQRGRASINEQLEACRALAVAKGYQIAPEAEFVDRDYTGRAYWRGCPVADFDAATADYLAGHGVREAKRYRPALTGLIAALPTIDIIVCRDATRLARPVPNSMLGQAIRQELGRHHVRIATVMDGELDDSSFAQRISNLIIEATEDHKIQHQVAASRASLQRLRNSGSLYHSPTCYGFCSAGKQKVHPVQAELATVKRIFQMALDKNNEKNTIAYITLRLNSEKVPTKKSTSDSPCNWSFWQVRTILKRPIYCGYQRGTGGELVESPVFTPHAVITLEEFQTVRQKLLERSGHTRVKKHIHPLSGLVRCGGCGHSLIIFQQTPIKATGERHQYYRCQQLRFRHAENAEECRLTMIRESQNNRYGVGLLESLLPLAVTGLRAEIAESRLDVKLLADKTELIDRLDKISKEERQIYQDSMDGVIDGVQKASFLSERREQRAGTEAALKAIQTRLEAMPTMSEDVLKMARELVDGTIDKETARRLVHKALKSVTVQKYSVGIELATGEKISLERIPDRNSRLMPRVAVTFANPENINEKIELTYLYKTAMQDSDHTTLEERVLLDTDSLRIATLGTNPEPLARRGQSR